MDYFKIQDKFHERMKMDYENGIITNPIYRPYFQWKFYGASIDVLSKQTCYTIMKEAQKELEELDAKHPDIVLRKYRTCIFVNGCFWHGHNVDIPSANELHIINSGCCKIPNTNRSFWVEKLYRNKERDKNDQRKLAEMGWHCITVWECELKPPVREKTLDSLAFTLNRIYLQDHTIIQI